MTTTWIIAADSSRARILQVTDREKRLAEIEDLLNPEARVDDRELTTGAHARFHGSSGPASDREEMSAPEHATELFAKRVGEYLDKARTATTGCTSSHRPGSSGSCARSSARK